MEGDEVLHVLCWPTDTAGGQRGKEIGPDFFFSCFTGIFFFRSRVRGREINKKALKMNS